MGKWADRRAARRAERRAARSGRSDMRSARAKARQEAKQARQSGRQGFLAGLAPQILDKIAPADSAPGLLGGGGDDYDMDPANPLNKQPAAMGGMMPLLIGGVVLFMLMKKK